MLKGLGCSHDAGRDCFLNQQQGKGQTWPAPEFRVNVEKSQLFGVGGMDYCWCGSLRESSATGLPSPGSFLCGIADREPSVCSDRVPSNQLSEGEDTDRRAGPPCSRPAVFKALIPSNGDAKNTVPTPAPRLGLLSAHPVQIKRSSPNTNGVRCM